MQRPGVSLGQIGWVIEVDDLDPALDVMTHRGGRVIAVPVAGDEQLHSTRRAATVESPEGVRLSVWER